MRYLFFLSLLASVSLCGCSGCVIPCDPIRVPISQALRWSAALLDNSGAAPLPAKNASVPREAFGIRLTALPTSILPTPSAPVCCAGWSSEWIRPSFPSESSVYSIGTLHTRPARMSRIFSRRSFDPTRRLLLSQKMRYLLLIPDMHPSSTQPVC